jgi:hypothetical protein
MAFHKVTFEAGFACGFLGVTIVLRLLGVGFLVNS